MALVTLSLQLVRSALPPVGSAMSSARLGSTSVTDTLSVATGTLPLVRWMLQAAPAAVSDVRLGLQAALMTLLPVPLGLHTVSVVLLVAPVMR